MTEEKPTKEEKQATIKAFAFDGCMKCPVKWPCPHSTRQAIVGGSRYAPGPLCPFPDIPIPHGTARMRSIEWKKAWDFIEKLSNQGILDNSKEEEER